MEINKPVIYGILGSLAMAMLYFGIMSWLSSPAFALQQYLGLWPWMTFLIIGFGFQIGLFMYVKDCGMDMHKKMHGKEKGAMAASTGTSTAGMLACCAHHAADVLPVLGLSGTALFVSQFQLSFLVMGIFSNLFGIVFMSSKIKQNHIKPKNAFMKWLSAIDHGKWIAWIIAIGVIAIAVSAFIAR